jgi:hypothetical protein
MSGDRKLIEDSSIVSEFTIKSDSARDLRAAVSLCFKSENTIYPFFKRDGSKLMLARSKDKDMEALPFPLTKENAYEFIYAWLHSFDSQGRRTENAHGDGEHGIGFTAEWFEWGKPYDVEFEAINIYYSK